MENLFKEQLFDFAPDGMLVVDSDGTILLTNDQADSLFGYEPGGLAGRHLGELIPARYRESHKVSLRNFTKSPQFRPMGSGLEISALKADGSELPVEISLSPLMTSEKQKLTVASVRDVSERQKSDRVRQAELARTEKKLKSMLAAAAHAVELAEFDSNEYHRALAHYTQIVRHRVANPLQVILGMTRTLLELGHDIDPQTRIEMLQHIEVAAQRLENMAIFIPDPNADEEASLHPKPFE